MRLIFEKDMSSNEIILYEATFHKERRKYLDKINDILERGEFLEKDED